MMVTPCFRYEANLKPTRVIGIQKGLVSGLGQGLVWTIAFGIIALAFWYGGVLVREDGYSPGFVLQVYIQCLMLRSHVFDLAVMRISMIKCGSMFLRFYFFELQYMHIKL